MTLVLSRRLPLSGSKILLSRFSKLIMPQLNLGRPFGNLGSQEISSMTLQDSTIFFLKYLSYLSLEACVYQKKFCNAEMHKFLISL
jgi:hypothetical protein